MRKYIVEINELSRSIALNTRFDSIAQAKSYLKEYNVKQTVKLYHVTDLYGNYWMHREYIDSMGTRYLLRIREKQEGVNGYVRRV